MEGLFFVDWVNSISTGVFLKIFMVSFFIIVVGGAISMIVLWLHYFLEVIKKFFKFIFFIYQKINKNN